MKEFNLQEYLANPSQKVITRDGRNVRIICTNMKSDYPIIGLVSIAVNKESLLNYKENGKYFYAVSENDLFFAPDKKKGWINIFRCKTELYIGDVFETKEEAEKMGKLSKNYITTIKIEWEE